MVQMTVGPLVRAISATSVTIWAEFGQPCVVRLQVVPQYAMHDVPITVSVHTVIVGGRYYAAPQLQGLQAATWYAYRICSVTEDGEEWQEEVREQCFRTLDDAVVGQADGQELYRPLRLAYGSCRKLDKPQADVLSFFGEWLLRHFEQREAEWPHLLLLIGDQIYADHPADALVQQHPQLRKGARNFEDFALSYEYAWAQDEGVRQVLAVLPTYMIFDDHEIVNNWNIAPQWQEEVIRSGHGQTLIDGLVAYWVYQGWGNLVGQEGSRHPLAEIMQNAAESGEDALEALRETIKLDVYGEAKLKWHYQIPTQPPIFVANTRTHRTTVFRKDERVMYAPARIMGREQMSEIRAWMRACDDTLAIFVSSVPLLLPPLIGCAEYFMGIRLWQRGLVPLRWLGMRIARVQMWLALETSFDHWPVFSATWQEFLQLLDERRNDVLVLSGDVHFSYAARARRVFKKAKVRLYQFVSTPLQNALTRRDYQAIHGQSFLKKLVYSGLITCILPLQARGNIQEIQRNLLFRNTLAYLRLRRAGDAEYVMEHDYLGVVDGRVEVIGSTQLKE